MKIAIIGAGFTGLSAGFRLAKSGHSVTIFEKEGIPGGLAVGFKAQKWNWNVEKHYHHWFTNDNSILKLAKEIGYKVLIKRPKTSVYVDDKIYKLDSPLDVLFFPQLNIFERIRMGLVIGILKLNPFWQILESHKASSTLPLLMGKKAYEKLWEPLLAKKFGDLAKEIVLQIRKLKGKVLFKTEVKQIKSEKNKITIKLTNKTLFFDKVIITLPSIFFVKLAPQLSDDYRKKLLSLKGLSAINLALRLRKKFLTDGTYWLNVCDQKYPITAIVEHTNFMDSKNYNNEHFIYLGNYLSYDHPFMKMDKKKLLKLYDPILSKINKKYKLDIIDTELFTAPF